MKPAAGMDSHEAIGLVGRCMTVVSMAPQIGSAALNSTLVGGDVVGDVGSKATF